MPQTTPNTTPVSAAQSVLNISAATAGVQVKSSKGVLAGLSINTGASGATVAVYDGTSTAGTKLGTFAATGQYFAGLGIPFKTGLFAVVTGAPDVTLSFT